MGKLKYLVQRVLSMDWRAMLAKVGAIHKKMGRSRLPSPRLGSRHRDNREEVMDFFRRHPIFMAKPAAVRASKN